MLEESLQDASKCVSLDKSWAKGYLRLGMAFQVRWNCAACVLVGTYCSYYESQASFYLLYMKSRP
mgnify:CR=1